MFGNDFKKRLKLNGNERRISANSVKQKVVYIISALWSLLDLRAELDLRLTISFRGSQPPGLVWDKEKYKLTSPIINSPNPYNVQKQPCNGPY